MSSPSLKSHSVHRQPSPSNLDSTPQRLCSIKGRQGPGLSTGPSRRTHNRPGHDSNLEGKWPYSLRSTVEPRPESPTNRRPWCKKEDCTERSHTASSGSMHRCSTNHILTDPLHWPGRRGRPPLPQPRHQELRVSQTAAGCGESACHFHSSVSYVFLQNVLSKVRTTGSKVYTIRT